MARTCQVIDVSHWNVVTDWSAVRGSGVTGVILKASEGTGYKDSAFDAYYEGALTAGLKVGAYHYLKPGSDDEIGDQMQLFNAVVGGSCVRCAIDYEAEGLTLNHLKQSLSLLSGLRPQSRICIYGSSLLKGQLGDSNDATLAAYPLWLAHYTTNPTWPEGTWKQWSLWQFNDGQNGASPKGEIKGITTGVVDHNVFDGDDAACAAWFDAEKLPTPGKLKVMVTAGSDVELQLFEDKSLEKDEVIVYAGMAKVWVTS